MRRNFVSNLIVSFLCCSIYYFFHEQIENFVISSSLVTQILLVKTNSLFKSVAFFIFIVSFFCQCYRYDFEFSSKLYFIPISCSLIYLYERNFGNRKINFAAIYGSDYIMYFDFVIILVDILLLITIFKRQEKSNIIKGHHGFFEDLELTDSSKEEDDILMYRNYAKRLAQNIEKSSFNKSFAIGVTGMWGSGKTSFMNLIKKSFDPKKVIFIHFNPWSSNNVNQLIPNFFDTVTEQLSNEGIYIKSDISKYLQKISQVELGILGESFKPVLNGFVDNFSIEDLKEKISDKIVSKEKKIVITIDDLDRLNKQEINEVLKLIRNTANFSNICYLVAYDKDYVINFLNTESEFNFRNYLEKIFQLEVNLPTFKKRLLIDKLKINLLELINGIQGESLKEQYKKQTENLTENNICLESIENLRDITRLSNALLTNFITLAGEVDIFDFINLEILRMKYRETYDLLKRDKYKILQDSKSDNDISTKRNRLILKDNFQEINKDRSIVRDENAVKILETIFYREVNFFYQDYSNTAYLYRLSTPSRFVRYFTYEIIEDELSLKELIDSLDSEVRLKGFIKQCVDAKKQFLLNEYFEVNDSFDSIETYKNFIKGLFYFSSQESYFKQIYFRNLIFVDSELILKKLRLKPSFFSDELFGFFYSEIFDIEHFDNEAFVKLNYLIDILKGYSPEYLILTKEKHLEIFDSLMRFYIRDCFSVNNEFGVVFNEVKANEKKLEVNIKSYEDLLKRKISNNLKNVLKDSLVKYSSSTQESYFTIHTFIREFLDDLTNFKKFLEQDMDTDLKNETFYKEYLRFLSEIIDLESKSQDREYKHVYIDKNLFD